MTVRHPIVMFGALVVGWGGIFAPLPSAAQAPGIRDAAPNEVLRTAARLDTTPAPTSTAPSTPVGGEPDDAGVEQRIVELVNAERSARGLRPLSADPRLAQAADIHARDQRNRSCRQLSHTGTDGSDVAERVDRTGYRWSRLAENIACGHPDAASVMTGWMNSAGHRRAILHPDHTHIGVSLARSDRGGTYWVQVFGTPR